MHTTASDIAVMPAPQRAQRVRGVPGVGLRTPDGREWLRWGRGHRWNPDTSAPMPAEPGWVVGRCTHDTGEFVRLDHWDWRRAELGLEWDICDKCRDLDMVTFTVRSCARPGAYGNRFCVERIETCPYGPLRCWGVRLNADSWLARWLTHDEALKESLFAFGAHVETWPNSWFLDLYGHDYLSCTCPLDQPCHVDAIIAEGVHRSIWRIP